MENKPPKLDLEKERQKLAAQGKIYTDSHWEALIKEIDETGIFLAREFDAIYDKDSKTLIVQ